MYCTVYICLYVCRIYIMDDNDALELNSVSSTRRRVGGYSVRWLITYHLMDDSYEPLDHEDLGEHLVTDMMRKGNSVSTHIRYATWQIEMGTELNKRHLQMFMEFDARVAAEDVRRLFRYPHHVYVKLVGHTPHIAIKYCQKKETREAGAINYEYMRHDYNEDILKRTRDDISPDDSASQVSTFRSVRQRGRKVSLNGPGQGRRSDINDLADLIHSGGTIDDVVTFHPTAMLRMPGGIQRSIQIARDASAPTSRKLDVYVIFGPTGTGKSHGVISTVRDLYVVDSTMIGSNGIWWDGYTGQNNVLLDEYNNWLTSDSLLRHLDVYTMRVQTKGSSIKVWYENLYITSNIPPWLWKSKGASFPVKHRGALLRRIKTIAEMLPTVTILHKRNGKILNTATLQEWTGATYVSTPYTASVLGQDSNAIVE